MRVAAFAAALASVLLGCPAERGPVHMPLTPPCTPHSVVLVRHAEKAPVDPSEKDPDLSPKGHERAVRLATLLGKSTPTHLFATSFKRTQQTLAPLAERSGKPVEVRDAARTNDLVRELINAAPGSISVVATHANVLPKIVQDLGGGALRGVGADLLLPDEEYSRVIVVSLGCGTSASVVELSSD